MIRAMVFDLDGTLVQTEKLKAHSYAQAAVRLRPELQPGEVVEAFKEVVGFPRRQVAQSLLRHFDLSEAAAAHMREYQVSTPWQAYVQLRLQIYQEMLADPQILQDNQWPHNMALLRQAQQICEKTALATMSHCRQAQRVLEVLNLQETFDFVATRDDVDRGKPDPEIYQLVADVLELPPADCLVIEDSPAGVAAAKAAGMAVVAVSTPFTKAGLRQSGLLTADRLVNDPSQLTAMVARIVAG